MCWLFSGMFYGCLSCVCAAEEPVTPQMFRSKMRHTNTNSGRDKNRSWHLLLSFSFSIVSHESANKIHVKVTPDALRLLHLCVCNHKQRLPLCVCVCTWERLHMCLYALMLVCVVGWDCDRDGWGRVGPARDLCAFASVTSDLGEAGSSGHALPPCIS